MIQDLGVASTPSQVGFYSGLVVRSIVTFYGGLLVQPCMVSVTEDTHC